MKKIGAGYLNIEMLPDDRIKTFASIIKQVEEIREAAAEYYEGGYYKVDSVVREDTAHNNISILGERGSGKTSFLLTILRHLEYRSIIKAESLKKERINEIKRISEVNSTNKNLEEIKDVEPNSLNYVMKIIDPDKFNAENDVLGWVIFQFEDVLEKEGILKDNIGEYCSEMKLLAEKVKKNYEELKRYYIKSKENYLRSVSGVLASNSELASAREDIFKSAVCANIIVASNLGGRHAVFKFDQTRNS